MPDVVSSEHDDTATPTKASYDGEREISALRASIDAGLRATNEEELFQRLCDAMVSLEEVDVAWTGLVEGSLIKKGPMSGFDDGYVSRLVITADPGSRYSQGPTGQAVLSARPVIVNDFLVATTTTPWHELADSVGFAASAAFPVIVDRQVVAAFTAYSRRSEVFTTELVNVLSGIREAGELALARLRGASPDWLVKDLALVRDVSLSSLAQGVVVVDAQSPDLPIIYCSPSFTQMTGYAAHEVLGRNCRFLQGPETSEQAVDELRKAIGAGVGVEVELVNYRRDGSTFWNHVAVTPVFDERGRLVRFVGVQVDVSERKRLESEVIRAQRFEAIGTLAGGIAHDFNNLLLVMSGYTDLLLRRAVDEDQRQIVARVKEAVERGAELTRHLLAYSRQQVRAPREHDLSSVVGVCENLVRGLVPQDVKVTFDLADGIGPVLVDESQVNQILINLVENSRDAMPVGGQLIVRTELVHVSEPLDQIHGEIRPGDYGVLEVADSGLGMDAETTAKMFEPFFTTKALGTGLGLASVIGIINQSGGNVAVSSRPGEGTSIQIFLPIVPLEDRHAHLSAETHPKQSRGGGETVLVVEDDEQARELVANGLVELGYRVLVADGGESALRLADHERGGIHAMVTDVVMPDINGRDLAEALWQTRGDLAVVFVSGYDQGILGGVDMTQRRSAFIEKPYSLADLDRVLRSLLEVEFD